MSNLSKATLDAIGAAVAAAFAANVAIVAPRTESAASAHYVAKDLPCPLTGQDVTKKGVKAPCAQTFSTAKGIAWHVANITHTK